MSTKNFFIFRSNELYLPDGNHLPSVLAESFGDSVLDYIDVVLSGENCRSVLLPSDSSVPPDGRWFKMRELFSATVPDLARLASPAARALGLVNWHHTHRYCGKCGSLFADHPKETARLCPSCGNVEYPRISPAIIVLVHKGDRILLARHAQRTQTMFACLAGYLEHGETLEECVAREVAEETGLEVQNIRYAGSQSWPFPDQHMIAFHADWKAGEIKVDPVELIEADWFPADQLPDHPFPGTVAWRLIHGDL
jgi:NAD+ diphosphatase